MHSNKLAKAFIKKSIEKSIEDIQDNSKRGIRNLVDLGEKFANGKYLKQFFNIAQNELYDADSVYYSIVSNTIQRVDQDHLITFCMNIGYNCWTRGAEIIREAEGRQGFNVPWAVIFYDEGGQTSPQHIIESAISQGKALGTNMYIFFYGKGQPGLNRLPEVLAAEDQCAFALFIDPADATGELAARVQAAQNTVILLNMRSDEHSLATACGILKDNKCLFGGYVPYTDFGSATNDEAMLEQACGLGMTTIIYAAESIMDTDRRENEQILTQMRNQLKYCVFPIDLTTDIVAIDRTISDQGCLAAVDGEGMLSLYHAEQHEMNRGYSLKEMALADIYRQALPK